ncbi:juvenile hormone epoxide hydrolase 2-like [Arctopsyche grandis]|uniref:juvenile hormone epoxide hydrolase 2-like n=1 Tax=Arctopsyche grandis TaxID=121162 RepID=UPI00406D67EB
MDCCCSCWAVYGILGLILAWIGSKILGAFPPSKMPHIPKDTYWGPGEPSNVDKTIKPFKIQFSKEMISDLIGRLKNTRNSESYENTQFQYGFNSKALKNVIEVWTEKYDFAERENYLNQFPQFKTNIQGLDIHFIHVKPIVEDGVKVLPLLILHGWPGSVREFYKVIPMLTKHKNGDNLAFEIIAPSLPGFGFSQGASKAGLGAVQIAVVMANLMERLGHKKYYVQGGDWGSIIGSHLTTMYGNNVLGYHSNMPIITSLLSTIKMVIGSVYPSLFVGKQFKNRVYPMKSYISTLIRESGYLHMNATKPDTIGVGLNDSPAGLAAFLLEKFANDSSKADGGLTDKFTYMELIDNVMMYWVSKSATTAARIYAESFNKAHSSLGLDSIPTNVPMAAARFPREIGFSTKWQLSEKYKNIIQVSDLPKGGHFAALEEPELLADDIRSAMIKFEYYYMI